MLTWEHPHCQPFRDLLAHPKIIPYMNTFFGRGWKLDHHPFMITGDMNTKKGKTRPQGEGNFHVGGGGTMHGSTARHFNGSQYYTYANGQMRNGMIVAAFQLRAINEGDGGFGLIPGVSHMSVVLLRPPAITKSRCCMRCAFVGCCSPTKRTTPCPWKSRHRLVLRRSSPFTMCLLKLAVRDARSTSPTALCTNQYCCLLVFHHSLLHKPALLPSRMHDIFPMSVVCLRTSRTHRPDLLQ